MKRIITGILFASLFDIRAQASTVNVASCSQADVQNALNSASTGDMIIVPAGNCSWSSVSVNKAVVIQGAGTGQTNITLSGSHAVTMTKQVSGVIRLQGFTFSASGGGEGSFPFLIQGPWQNAQPIIIRNNDFEQNNNSLFAIVVAGGVVFSHNVFNGGWNDGCFAVKDLGNTPSWTMADSMGNRDTNGTLNLYIEDNTFYGHSNGTIDCDDNCRVVMRYNTFSYGGFNSHGKDTSPYGMRHFEIYNNNFLFPESSSTLANVNQTIWIRGGTGVIFNNAVANLIGESWGDKPEVRLSIRGAEDARPQGTCGQVSYPVPHQLGRNNNGTSDFTDPIYFWGNTGTIGFYADWQWGNPCGFTWSTFFDWGRDAVNGSTVKPGYAPYTYPHPLLQVAPPSAPTNLRIVP